MLEIKAIVLDTSQEKHFPPAKCTDVELVIYRNKDGSIDILKDRRGKIGHFVQTEDVEHKKPMLNIRSQR